jgi:hypothetical protein
MLLPFAANAGVEGTYTIDQDKLIKRAHARIDKNVAEKKMPAARAARAKKFAKMIISTMKMQLVLGKGGKYSSSASMQFMGRKRNSSSNGTWKQEKGGAIVINSETKKRGKLIKRTIHCKMEGKHLACSQTNKRGRKQTMYFNKVK